MATSFEISAKIVSNFYNTAIYLFKWKNRIFWPYTEVNIKIKCPVYISIVINTEVNAFCLCIISLLSGVNTSMLGGTNFGPENGLTPVWAKPLCKTGLAYTQLHNPKEHNLRKVHRDLCPMQ